MYSENTLLEMLSKNKKNGVLVDVGAHYGTFSESYAKKGWRIIAFEPEKENRKFLKKNLGNLKNVKIIPYAVSDTEGTIPFYVSNKYFGIHAIKPFDKSHEFAYKVKSVTLDEFLPTIKINKVDILKIDIEGADFLALKGFSVSKYKPSVVMVEFMDSRSMPIYGYTYKDMVKYMEGKGYHAYISEWGKIKEYGQKNKVTEPHKWKRLVLARNMHHKPEWGNIIFIKDKYLSDFIDVKDRYLEYVYTENRNEKIKYYKLIIMRAMVNLKKNINNYIKI